ncbi:16S rRNA (cytidine(1402)-2'-O)-methyltransferase [Pseudovibrio exalbescens]|uniref:16S rRNA (cytidine(1402)-2'-O)-methyltransferase n=1 Tax=Pseudovibrio exalbescens TaxID=197461 RepID=UPI002365D513|nr:16S rRNA (cytidine(1402)-2'-O)-methyltransferase [Pseudovibrio exalbescens]MDD7909583.1 16S rRNA (cytidine(1402)-2'-O)-methyltransferase [Pseudovibrio exalbescens]
MEHEQAVATRRFSIGENTFNARSIQSGLYIVSTPIGNLGDITVRALETLAACDFVACEDTRVTGVLMQRFGLKTPLMTYHEHNAAKQRPKILEALEAGKAIALVSDAGTPLISDPGYRLVNDVVEAGHSVFPIPGASALLTGLVGAGLPSDTVLFAGFLSQKAGARQKRLEEVKDIPATLIFYESPHRLSATLADMARILGPERPGVVARELTKKFEEFQRAPLQDLVERYSGDRPKGEIVILIGPPAEKEPDAADADRLLLEALQTMPVSAAAKTVSKATGLERKTLYARAMELKDGASNEDAGDDG